MAKMYAGARTPAEVIAIALEDGGLTAELARVLSEDAAQRLAIALHGVSRLGAEVVARRFAGEGGSRLEWATVHTNPSD